MQVSNYLLSRVKLIGRDTILDQGYKDGSNYILDFKRGTLRVLKENKVIFSTKNHREMNLYWNKYFN